MNTNGLYELRSHSNVLIVIGMIGQRKTLKQERGNEMTTKTYFTGSWGWLLFWTLFAPLIAFLYLLFNNAEGTFTEAREVKKEVQKISKEDKLKRFIPFSILWSFIVLIILINDFLTGLFLMVLSLIVFIAVYHFYLGKGSKNKK